MKVIQVVGRIDEEASGSSITVQALCKALAEQGVDIELHVGIGNKKPEAKYKIFTHGVWKWPNRLALSPAMYMTLKKRVKNSNIIHTNSLWQMQNVYPGWAVRGTNCRLVVSPHGTLGEYPLSQSRWKKRIFWLLWQKRVLQEASCIHATCEAEYREIRAMNIKTPVAIIPNGVNLPKLTDTTLPQKSQLRRLLFLGRIAPIKGIDNLLRAWVRIQRHFHDWELVITGLDDRGYKAKMEILVKKLAVEQVKFTDPVYGENKIRAYRAADIFVLPTHSENFGMVIAEALGCEVPVIVTKGAPWQGLEKESCGWWIDIGVEPLIECLREAMSKPREELAEMGVRGRKWVESDFSWERIGKKMLETYTWIIDGGKVPEWIRID